MTPRRYASVEDFEHDAKTNFDTCAKCLAPVVVETGGEIVPSVDYLAAPFGLAFVYTTKPVALKSLNALNTPGAGSVDAQGLLIRLPVLNVEVLMDELEAGLSDDPKEV